jgi:hypothetical protein
VSSSVIESLSRVLLLDKQERKHLYLLANQPIPTDVIECQRGVSPSLQHVLDSLAFCPSLVTDQRWNVIAWNKEANLLFGNFEEMNARERNIVWEMFTDIKYKQMFSDWNLYAKHLLGAFRASCGQYIEDLWLVQLVDDLKMQSTEFNAWWSLHEIENSSVKYKKLDHPTAGLLEFEVNNLDVSDNLALKLIIHVPSPRTDTAEKMKSLLDK